MTTRPSGLAAADRFGMQSQILEDADLSAWFFAVAQGQPPQKPLDEVTLALLEARGIIHQTQYGPVLGTEGRQFARDLGIVLPASQFEIDPQQREQTKHHRLPDERLENVWRAYANHRTSDDRNLLLGHYLEIVHHEARHMHKRLPSEVDVEDLVSAGYFGLLDAIEAFKPERGVRFEILAAQRIRGRIFDELRSMDWVPRLVRTRAKKYNVSKRTLEQSLSRNPSDEEIRDQMNISRAGFEKILRDSKAVRISSFGQKLSDLEPGADSIKGDLILDSSQENPLSEVQRRDLKWLIFSDLSRTERLVLILYYYEEMTMKEIAMALELSESRVSQMHSSCLAQLQTRLHAKEKEL